MIKHTLRVYDEVMAAHGILESAPDIYSVHTRAAGPAVAWVSRVHATASRGVGERAGVGAAELEGAG